MNLLIDHAGLQSGGLCLQRNARDESDLLGFLQFATLLIFADDITLNGFAAKRVLDESNGILDKLRDLDLTDGVIKITTRNQDAFATVCADAAESCAEAVEFGFRPLSSVQSGLLPTALGKSADDGFRRLLQRLDNRPSADYLEEVKKHAFLGDYIGAVDYMIATCDVLREQVLTTARENEWRGDALIQLRAFLRTQVYLALARADGANYTPATSRAALYRKQYYFIAEFLEKMKGVVDDYREYPLPIPSVYAYLIKKSKAEPNAIIKEALDVRERSTRIRNQLSSITRDFDLFTSEGRARADLSLADLMGDLHRTLGKTREQKGQRALSLVGDAVTINPGNVSKIVDMISTSLRSRRVALLTDLSIIAIDPKGVDEDWMKFKKACGLGVVRRAT